VFALTSEESFPVLTLSETKGQVFRFWLRSCFACCHPGNIIIQLLRSVDGEGYKGGALWKSTPVAITTVVS